MPSRTQVTHEDISRRAHQIWELSGRQEGHEIEQWLQAERELLLAEERKHVQEWEESGVETQAHLGWINSRRYTRSPFAHADFMQDVE